MANRNTSHLAGEFLVAGELSRRGYLVSITMGNAKAVDIHADTRRGTIRIDAKAGRAKGNWPIVKSSVQEGLYYVFVYLQTENKVKENKPPEYFVASGEEILSKNLIKWRKRQGIPYKTLNTGEYKGRWDKLPSPPDSES